MNGNSLVPFSSQTIFVAPVVPKGSFNIFYTQQLNAHFDLNINEHQDELFYGFYTLIHFVVSLVTFSH